MGEGEAGQNVLLHSRPLLHIWLQDPVWWRKVHWFRSHLRHHGLRQEVRAQIQAAEAGCIEAKTRGSRKQRKEKKNRTKKVRGIAKAKVGQAGKKVIILVMLTLLLLSELELTIPSPVRCLALLEN